MATADNESVRRRRNRRKNILEHSEERRRKIFARSDASEASGTCSTDERPSTSSSFLQENAKPTGMVLRSAVPEKPSATTTKHKDDVDALSESLVSQESKSSSALIPSSRDAGLHSTPKKSVPVTQLPCDPCWPTSSANFMSSALTESFRFGKIPESISSYLLRKLKEGKRHWFFVLFGVLVRFWFSSTTLAKLMFDSILFPFFFVEFLCVVLLPNWRQKLVDRYSDSLLGILLEMRGIKSPYFKLFAICLIFIKQVLKDAALFLFAFAITHLILITK